MISAPDAILLHVRSLPEGSMVSPNELVHLGSNASIRQALCQLSKEGKLLRVAPGTYVAPVTGRFGVRAPASTKVVQAWVVRTGEIIVPHGASAANALGLTLQVPIREIYLTSGRTRTLKLGKSEVAFKHAPPWMLVLGTRPAGAAVCALAWMGPAHVHESLATLHHVLSPDEWKLLTSVRNTLPSWMAKAIEKEASSF